MPKTIKKGICSRCYIRNRSIFSELSYEQLDKLQNFSPTVTSYQTKEVIYYQNDNSSNAFTLRSGMVKLTKSLPDGRTQIIRILKQGDLFGFDGFANQNYNQTATALTECELCHLPITGLQKLRQSEAEIDTAIMNRWLNNLNAAENMMLTLGAQKASERLANFLVHWGEEENDEWKKMPLSRKDIGDLLGLTIETVSRFLSQWKKMGLIQEYRGNVLIKNKTELCEVINPKGTCE